MTQQQEPEPLIAPVSRRVAYYVPDRVGEDQEPDASTRDLWLTRLATFLSSRNNGATVIDSMRGFWLSDSGELLFEKTKLVYSYIWTEVTLEIASQYIAMAVQFGKHTSQEAVIVEINGHVYLIRSRDFDYW